MIITTDASMFGIGGIISKGGKIQAYFRDEITEIDEEVLDRKKLTNEGQQAWEGLAMLVALRTWALLWKQRRVRLLVRGDNNGALAALSALKGKGSLTVIAQEFALDIGDSEFVPAGFLHIPGVSNVISDALSRYSDPKKQPWQLPVQLRHLERTALEKRTRDWWKTLRLAG